MNTEKEIRERLIDYFTAITVSIVFAITIIIILIAVFDKNNEGEASVGTFEVYEYNDGWQLSLGNVRENIDLPANIDCNKGDVLTIINTLPENLADNMSLMIRASMEEVYTYVDGQLREQYTADDLSAMEYYIPSAYVVTKLDGDDSGKEIRIELKVKADGIINGITIGYGNDVWYPVFKNNMAQQLAAFIVLVLGIVLSVAMIFVSKKTGGNQALKRLGILMIDAALWVISESAIRQFIFRKPSLAEFFAYLTIELLGVFAIEFFDAVQHKRYHKIYRIVEIVVLAQILINLILQACKIKYFYDTLILSHVWTVLGIVTSMVLLVKDILDKSIKQYTMTACGIVCFLVMGVAELAEFYISRFSTLGAYVCIGLILMMLFTILQAVYDFVASAIEREKRQLRISRNALETIAGSIDAKDEYTGGHSERVGLYAQRLAREIAADYDFSEEDILRIKDIGLVHDIGKVGVADAVLNKAGRLTDEEFSLMKKHVEIGYEIMSASGEMMEGLLDGIRYHHERFDGKGYPSGLADTEIPLVARILSLADSYDAMTSNRVYRRRLTDEDVKNELLRCAGTQFDPSLTAAFVRLIDRGELDVKTLEGMSTDEAGNVLLSAKLENKLQVDLLNKVNVNNPSHVRMMCYVIKLYERKGKNCDVLFYGPDLSDEDLKENAADAWDRVNASIKGSTTGQDMMIRYNDEFNVIALVDKHELLPKIIEKMKTDNPSARIFDLGQGT